MNIGMGTLLKRTGGVAALGGAGLFALSIAASPAMAAGNPNFDGVIAAATPTGFPVSPASLDASAGPATVNFDTLVSNLTSSEQTTPLNFSADHIVTYKGANVADGQPGKPGITFNGPVGTVQQELSGRQSFTLTLSASEKNHKLALTRTISACGYYQLDVWAVETAPNAPRDRETLASGFIRVLGCGVQPTPTPSPTSSVQGISTGVGGGVHGVTSPSTGADLVGPGAGGLALVTLGLGLVAAGARRKGVERITTDNWHLRPAPPSAARGWTSGTRGWARGASGWRLRDIPECSGERSGHPLT